MLLKYSPRTQDKDHYVVVISRLWRISDNISSECWSYSSLLEGTLNTLTICIHRGNIRFPTDLWLVGSLLLSFWRLQQQRRLGWPFVVLDLGSWFCRLCTALIKIFQVRRLRHLLGLAGHFPWRSAINMKWHLGLCFQPWFHEMVLKISVHGDPWQRFSWFWFVDLG